MAERKFKSKVPCEECSIDDKKYLPIHQQLPLLVEQFRGDITKEQVLDLLCHQRYIRLMLYQDSPASEAYMYAYCRPIPHDMVVPENCTILGEVNYATRAFYFNVCQDLSKGIEPRSITLFD